MSQLIAFGGVAFSGKDASADILVEEAGFYKTFMSKPLEQALLAINPDVNVSWDTWEKGTWPKDYLYFTRHIDYKSLHELVGYDLSKCCSTVRQLLQRLGTEFGRNMIGENVWLDLVLREVDEHLAAGQSVAITGCRYRNELDAVQERGGLTVWVERGLAPVNDHSSDNSLSSEDFDVIVVNDGTLKQLQVRLFELLGISNTKAA